jgi:hypothetical protein
MVPGVCPEDRWKILRPATVRSDWALASWRAVRRWEMFRAEGGELDGMVDPAMTSTGNLILVTGGTGTVGRRVAARLRDQGVAGRPASRHTEPPLDWSDPASWEAALQGVAGMYLLLPDYTELPEGFLERAVAAGVRRVVLHSDRSVEVMNVTHLQKAERQVRQLPLEWTIVRADWFNQDFETFFRESVIRGACACRSARSSRALSTPTTSPRSACARSSPTSTSARCWS